jgi:predicted Zn-dependent protease
MVEAGWNRDWRAELRKLITLLLSTLVSGLAVANELPDFGNAADVVLSKSREQQLGRRVMLQLRNAGVILDDPQLTEYVSLLGSRLASHAHEGDYQFEFFVVNDSRINAFAMPGGHIGVNSGLMTAGQAAAAQRQLNFTRANEYEADRIGIDVLAAAGFDPNGMSSFFEKLSRRYGASGQMIPELLRSHPYSASRVAEARGRARLLPAVTNVDSPGYGLAKARLIVLTQPTPEAALAVLEPSAGSSAPADRYGRALALMRAGLHDDAERIFRGLIAESPGIVAYRIGQAEALFEGGVTDEAMAVYRDAIRLSPRNVPLTISYAERLIEAGEPSRAHAILLARAANAEGDVPNAHNYMAEYYLSIGNLPLALNQLRMALELPDVNAVDQARFRAKLERLIEFLPEEERAQAAIPR